MTVEVLYFGVLKDVVGAGRERVELTEGACVGDVVASMRERAAGRNGAAGASVWSSVAAAVNREYAGRGTVLKEGDEVALLPPVSGGRDAG